MNLQTIKKLSLRTLITACLMAPGVAMAQQPAMQFHRPYDKTGINTFETTKTDTTPFTGLKVRIGGAFEQVYQDLSDQNYVTNTNGEPIANAMKTKADSGNVLTPLSNNFDLAMANMYLDAQLADGVRVNVTLYLASHHHTDTWVKNGYIQFDKLPFLHSSFFDGLMQYLTIDIGQLEVDYGDAHYRRSDGGNGMYNPFIENYIMDEFSTEVGGEVYFHSNGFLAMVGATNGQLNPNITKITAIDKKTGDTASMDPAILAKIGYDDQVNSDLRIRLTGSLYTESSSPGMELFGGDRTGSRYVDVVDNAGNPFDGRFNPGFSNAVTTFMINPFIKYDGLEFFGTYESANGRTWAETDTRNATQLAGDLIYRFGSNENFWVGVRYNTVKAQLAPVSANIPDITINRIAASLGWFLTDNIMAKAEYVDQQYKDFPATDIRNGAQFNGVMIDAAIGF